VAVTDGVKAVVEQSVVPREWFDLVSTPVVLPTAAVRRDIATQFAAVRRYVTGAAPVSTRHDQLPPATTSGSSLLMLLLLLLLLLKLRD